MHCNCAWTLASATFHDMQTGESTHLAHGAATWKFFDTGLQQFVLLLHFTKVCPLKPPSLWSSARSLKDVRVEANRLFLRC